MKRLKTTLFLSALTLLYLVSCKKLVPPTEESKALFGEWTYRGSSGGFYGAGEDTRFEQGDWVKFTEKGVFSVHNGSKKKSQKRYKIELKESIFSASKRQAIVYGNGKFESFLIHGDTLLINEEIYDGYGYLFVRK